MQTTLSFNPKLFNGALNEQLVAQQQRDFSSQQNAQIESHQQQQQQQHQTTSQLNQNVSMSSFGASLTNQQQGPLKSNNSFF